ncbi:hypothetical protein BA190_26895 [Labrys sp. WJW]|uniref:hypothetical protein n=1 Tax=Labrys sp. WJW TaxID=1737983 RepID=UPI00082A85C0|nr:hypothetical protein [Labrys sp. WJW]OCC01843.1 hypothetical protein BA190_26895 [Labrys sp. WJW]
MTMLIPAAFSALTSAFTGGTAAATTAGAAATTASTFSLGSLFTTMLSGGATAISAMAAMNAGKQQAAAYNLEASQAMADNAQESVEGRVRRDSMRKDLIKQLGEQDVAYAASGLDLSFGSPLQARDDAKADAARALSTDLDNETVTRNRLTQRAQALRAMARDAKSAGRMKALGLAFDFGTDVLKRG